MSTAVGKNGWLRLMESVPLRHDYWAEDFNQAEKLSGVGEIFGYRTEGVAPIQWINPLYDKAIVLAADGGWRTGGDWHVWFSHGARSRPVDLTEYVLGLGDHKLARGEPEWLEHRAGAAALVEGYFDLA